MATETYILIIDPKTGIGIGYDRLGNVVKPSSYYGSEFTSGYYKETTTGSLDSVSGVQTTLEKTGNVPSNFQPALTITPKTPKTTTITTTTTTTTTSPTTTTTPAVPAPPPPTSQSAKPITTTTKLVPRIGDVYKIPLPIDKTLPVSKQVQLYRTVLILSPTEAKITYEDGSTELIKLTNEDLQQLNTYAEKGYGPELSERIVDKATGTPVNNTGEVPPSAPPSNVDTITSVSSALPEASSYAGKTKPELLKDIELTNGLLQDSIVQLQNVDVVDADGAKTNLYDRINQGGITPELRAQYGDLIDNYLQKRAQKQALVDAIKEKIDACIAADAFKNKSWCSPDPECPDGFNLSELRALEAQYEKEVRELPDPCGKSTLAGINTALLKFFEFLKGMKKYYNLYVLGTINKIQSISALISNISSIIGSILKLLVQRMRNFILNLVRKLIEKVINKILTSLTKALKNLVIKGIVDAIICAFDKIIDGLGQLITDFLFSLIGNVINSAFCAVEQFTNALLNNLSAQIDKTLKPILNQIQDVLGGVVKIAGSVFQAIDFILGFEAFLCSKPDCPQIKSFKADAWAGPTPAMEEAFNNFIPIPTAEEAEQWLAKGITGFLDKNNILTGATIFGDKYTNLNENLPGNYQSLLSCNTGAWRCGPPKVEFFGGGGFGAVGDAVVNKIGEVVGVNLRYGGGGYTSPPFVSFVDNCNSGSFASAYSVINDRGEVVKVIMVNTGGGYLSSPTGLDEFGNLEEEFGDQIENVITEYVACLDEIQVLGTGIGYLPTDTISITPDVPGLQVKVQMNDFGQIIAMNVLTPGCGVTETPEITINSKTGVGLEVRPILSFTDKKTYIEDNVRPDFNPSKVIQVVDCVFK